MRTAYALQGLLVVALPRRGFALNSRASRRCFIKHQGSRDLAQRSKDAKTQRKGTTRIHSSYEFSVHLDRGIDGHLAYLVFSSEFLLYISRSLRLCVSATDRTDSNGVKLN